MFVYLLLSNGFVGLNFFLLALEIREFFSSHSVMLVGFGNAIERRYSHACQNDGIRLPCKC